MSGAPSGMRVCLLTTDFLPNIGGIAAHVYGLGRGLMRVGHPVDVVVPQLGSRNPLGARRAEVVDGLRVVHISVPRIPRLARYYFARWAARHVRALRPAGYDVVHWHTPLDGALAARIPAPLRVFTNHTSHFLQWELEGQNRALARRVLDPADAVISPSQELTAATVSTGFDPGRTWTIPNGVDAERFSPQVDGAGVRRKYGIEPHERVVLCPRRLEKKNGVPFWLRSLPIVLGRMARSETVRFLLVGDYLQQDQYSDRENVLRIMKELALGDRLMWVGTVPNEQMPSYFAASDIVVLPSLMEATSIAGLEAMASGIPLVATHVGGIPEIVQDGKTGVLVEPASAAALADAVLRLLENDSLRREMGQTARRTIESDFTWDAVAARTAAVYETCMGVVAAEGGSALR